MSLPATLFGAAADPSIRPRPASIGIRHHVGIDPCILPRPRDEVDSDADDDDDDDDVDHISHIRRRRSCLFHPEHQQLGGICRFSNRDAYDVSH